LAIVEVHRLQSVVPHRPYNWSAQSYCITGLEVDSATIYCEIRDKKFALPDSSNNFIVDAIVMFNAIHADRIIARAANAGFEPGLK
jgi:hypothetical protein